MINQRTIIVFDFETGGLTPGFHEPIQVAGKAYDPRTLEPLPNGEFSSMMNVKFPDRLEQKALDVNKKTREEILAAPDPKIIWNQFVAWVGKYNHSGKQFDAPIPAGKNIRNFDMKFVEVMNKQYSPKKDKTVLFHDKYMLDLEDDLFRWFYNDPSVDSYSQNVIFPKFGINTKGAHDALVDCQNTGDLLMRFLKLCAELRRKVKADGTPLIKFFKQEN